MDKKNNRHWKKVEQFLYYEDRPRPVPKQEPVLDWWEEKLNEPPRAESKHRAGKSPRQTR